MNTFPIAMVAVLMLALASGANDNFKGVATLFGSGLLSYRRALTWATVTTLAGSLSAAAASGSLVARFGGKGLVADAVLTESGFLPSVAIGAAGTVLLATRLGFPVSTTHALTGALLGAALVVAGAAHVSYATLATAFVLPLLLSPLVSLGLAAALYSAFRRARRVLHLVGGQCVCVTRASVSLAVAEGGAFTGPSGPSLTVDRIERCERRGDTTLLGIDVAAALDRLHVLSGGAVSFARGLNDTPKITAMLVTAKALGADANWFVAAAIAAGGVLAATRVARTLAFGITGMDRDQGLCANVVTAALVATASPLGLPVSTTHVACGALIGIGASGAGARWSTVRGILAAWATTLPVAAALGAVAALALS